jgi:proteasome assembly chaperone (PAC2) family protein
MIKLTNQLAIVIVSAIVGLVGLVLGLAVFAAWSSGAIIGMASGIGSVLVSLIVAVRGQQITAQELQRQTTQLDTITEQTNGTSTAEREDIARRAAAAAVRAFRP